MVEQGRPPFNEIVTTVAMRRLGAGGELSGMGVLVAFLTDGGRLPEVHILQRRFEIGRFVATSAFDAPMRADERVAGGVVIETGELVPGRLRVAGLATGD